MKRIIPVFIAIALIFIIVGVGFGKILKEKYSYSDERADLNEYFGILESDEAAILMQDQVIEDKALVKDGVFYFEYDTVSDYFIYTRLYVNEAEQYIRYVLPDGMIHCNIGQNGYSEVAQDGTSAEVDCGYVPAFYQGDTLYIAVDFIRLFMVFDYTTFGEPNRIQVYTEYEGRQTAKIKKDTQVRYQGGIKSEILTDVSEGDRVILLEQMETWSKVKTEDGIIGYVENKKIDDIMAETPIFADDSSKYGDREFAGNTRDHKINLGWHQIGAPAGNDTLEDVLAGTKALNTISPTWFYLTGDQGDIVSYASPEYVSRAHDKGLEVWALADDFTESVDDYAIFSSTENRARLISNLLAEVERCGIDGLNIDFERVSEDAGKHFVQFIRELSIQTRARGIVLSVDNYPPSGGTIWYNRKEQGTYADYVIIMGYDEHWGTGGVAGSVSSIDYVENGITDTLQYVPAEKLINAIPFYTRIWRTTGTETIGESVGMRGAMDFVSANQIALEWQEDVCQNYGEVQNGDTYCQIWVEDYDSVKVKLDVMKNYNLAGVAEWKLGLETPDVWDLIEEYIHS